MRKKLDNLFNACAQLEEKPEIIIVGDGPDRRHFELTASRIYPKAVFVGMKYGDELKKYYEETDLFVLPGTGGLAVQEAMANGMPVVVAQGDGTQDDLVGPKNGWLIPPDDVPALTATLREALSDLPRLRKMGVESYKITKEEINIETMADKFINAINTVNGQDK
jgi:glycosyltransferase involved in cell wall biosynthesis